MQQELCPEWPTEAARSFALWLRDVAAINPFFRQDGYPGDCVKDQDERPWPRRGAEEDGAVTLVAPDPAPQPRGVGRARPGRRERSGRGDRGSLGGSPAVIPGLGAAGAYWAAGVGAALALLAVHLMLRRQTVVMTRGALVVTERSLLPARTWREPLSSYREIRCQVEQRPHRYGRRSWYVVRLWHPEPGKRVELARARDAAAIEERARDCARRLGLPLVWEQRPSIIADQTSVPGRIIRSEAGLGTSRAAPELVDPCRRADRHACRPAGAARRCAASRAGGRMAAERPDHRPEGAVPRVRREDFGRL